MWHRYFSVLWWCAAYSQHFFDNSTTVVTGLSTLTPTYRFILVPWLYRRATFLTYLRRGEMSRVAQQIKRRIPKMAKFILQKNERMYKSGIASYLKSTVNVKSGGGYLTSERFVFATYSSMVGLFLGPLLQLFTKPNNIDFEFPLSSLRSIHQEKHGLGQKHILTCDRGDSYAMGFRNSPEWYSAFKSVMEDVYPDFQTKQIGDRIDISPGIHSPSINTHESDSTNVVGTAVSAADELKKFAVLKETGVITEAEFEEKKRKLLE